jgi:parvulin-like peptidyl-prolyl isomerase
MKRMALIAFGLAAAFACGVLAGSMWSGRANRAAGGYRVAAYRGGEVVAPAVHAALLQEPAALRVGSPQIARRVLDDLVRNRVLASLAMEKGYDREPELAQRQAEQLATVYVEKEFEAPERAKAPSDGEVRSYFEAHRGEFARPERVRVALISFPAAKQAERDAKRSKAQAVLAEAQRREADYYAFGELARKKSEDPRTAVHQGELPFMTREELAAAASPEVATAAFATLEAGSVLETVIEATSGLYVVKLLGREPAQDPKFEELRDTLRTRLASERRAEHRKAFIDGIWKQANVRVDEAALERVVSEARAGRR